MRKLRENISILYELCVIQWEVKFEFDEVRFIKNGGLISEDRRERKK